VHSGIRIGIVDIIHRVLRVSGVDPSDLSVTRTWPHVVLVYKVYLYSYIHNIITNESISQE
jgi:hypothetical protein